MPRRTAPKAVGRPKKPLCEKRHNQRSVRFTDDEIAILNKLRDDQQVGAFMRQQTLSGVRRYLSMESAREAGRLDVYEKIAMSTGAGLYPTADYPLCDGIWCFFCAANMKTDMTHDDECLYLRATQAVRAARRVASPEDA